MRRHAETSPAPRSRRSSARCARPRRRRLFDEQRRAHGGCRAAGRSGPDRRPRRRHRTPAPDSDRLGARRDGPVVDALPTTRRRPSRSTIDWQRSVTSSSRRRSRCPSTTTIPTATRSSCSSCGARRTTRRTRSGRCSSTRAGPAPAARQFAAGADFIFDDELLDRFDIIGWDPRGTGFTEPAIDCIDDYDEYFAGTDITPDDEAERQELIDVAEDFQDQCATKNADILQHVGTNDSARDMDSIRQALGEDQISLLRVQLRQRARRDVGDAVPRHGPGRGARRGGGSRRSGSWRVGSSRPAGSRARSTRTSRRAARIPTASSTTAATPRVRSTT